MNLIESQTTNLERHRVEMRASIIFDVILPEDATEQEVIAQAAMDYHNAVDSEGGFTVRVGLPDCRLYIYTRNNLDPAEIEIVDTESFEEDEVEC